MVPSSCGGTCAEPLTPIAQHGHVALEYDGDKWLLKGLLSGEVTSIGEGNLWSGCERDGPSHLLADAPLIAMQCLLWSGRGHLHVGALVSLSHGSPSHFSNS